MIVEDKKMNDLIKNIEKWATDRNLHTVNGELR